MSNDKERLAKFIAKTGFCSRREAEAYILKGDVFVNGKLVSHPAFFVGDKDEVQVQGKKLKAIAASQIWIFHKPAQFLCTKSDPQGRAIIFDLLPSSMKNLHLIGRLDFLSEGLLLLTNSPALKRQLELPSNRFERRYLVQTYGKVPNHMQKQLAKGVRIDGMKYAPIELTIQAGNGLNAHLTFTLTEGKNREIRNICKYYDLRIKKLIRLSYGPYQLGNLKKGTFKEVSNQLK